MAYLITGTAISAAVIFGFGVHGGLTMFAVAWVVFAAIDDMR